MSTPTLPIEGWVDTCASYGLTIMRALVTEIRDHGPLRPEQAKAIIRREGVGADVAKASPTFDLHDGTDRILAFFLSDVDVVALKPDGSLYIAPEVTTARSAAKNLTITVETADMLEAARDVAYRRIHLRRWIEARPFQSVWRDGIVKHSEEEIVAMADVIREFGYHRDFPITQDQFGLVIDGHLRLAALAKLGIDPKPYMQIKPFANDVERLAWYLAGHCHNGRWSIAVRDSVLKAVNSAAKRSGVKMEWPQDLAVAIGQFDSIPGAVQPIPEPVPEPTHVKVKSKARQGDRARSQGNHVPGVGRKHTNAILMLLERGAVPKTELDHLEGSYSNIRDVYHWIEELPGADKMVILSEKGLGIARKTWSRDRKGRNVPDYDIEALRAAHQPVTGIATLA